ncbi:MAG: archease [Deltaproteobacteria bacterium]|nr:archease [Deltaproteobacteria bacterium]
MPYSYIEHISDVCIRAQGHTLEEAFEAGAEAMLNCMFGLETIEEKNSVEIIAEAGEIDLLFVEVMNEVLSIQGRDGLALKRLKAEEISSADGRLTFKGAAFGEKFDPEKHAVKTEVKAATYSGLRYSRGEKDNHILECVLDV